MNKKFFNRILMGVLFVASAISFGSCEDWEGEINNLQGQIDELKGSVAELQELVNAGAVITDVEKGNDGVVVTLSDGSTFTLTNGQDGKDGEPGKDADVWTINPKNGLWQLNGEDTEFVAVGKDGAPGKDGEPGKDGTGTPGKDGEPGKDADIWTPGTDGFWYKNGEKQADFSWRAQGVTALVDGNVLKLYGIGEEFGDSAFIELGAQLGSVAFEAEKYSSVLPLPTHKDDFLHVGNLVYAAAAPFNRLETSTDWMGNTIQLPYRLNPEDAFIGKGLIAQFVSVNASLATTRGNVSYLAQQFVDIDTIKLEEGNGRFVVDAKLLAPEAINANEKILTTALMVNQGTHAVLSDYIRVASKEIDVDIYTNATSVVAQKEREVELPADPEKEYVTCVEGIKNKLAPALEVTRGTSVNLHELYILAEEGKNGSKAEEVDLEKVGFKYSLEFTLVETKAIGSTDQTEQEYYVTLAENGELTVNKGAAVVGKTPIIRIDAKIDGVLVESAYAQILVTNKAAEPETEDADIFINLDEFDGKANEIMYSTLSAAWTVVDTLDWKNSTEKIYNELDITTEDFWKLYSYADRKYTVYTYPVGSEDSINVLQAKNVVAPYEHPMAKISVHQNLSKADQRNFTVAVKINNEIWTDKSWARDGKYVAEIVIPRVERANIGKKRDVIIRATFNVVQDGEGYTLRKDNAVNNVVTAMPTTADRLVANRLATYIAQHFVNQGEFDLFNTFAKYNEKLGGSYKNVEKANFRYVPLKDEVNHRAEIGHDNADPTELAVVLLDTLNDQEGVLLDIEYDVIYANNDTLTYDYDVQFVTPFVASVAKADTIFLNSRSGEVALDRLVNVVTKIGKNSIYTSAWQTDPLQLPYANEWAINSHNLKFEFDMNDVDTKYVKEELLATDSEFKIVNDGKGGKLVYNYRGNTVFNIKHEVKLNGKLEFFNATGQCLYSFDIPVNVVLSEIRK